MLKIQEVTDSRGAKDFIRVNVEINKNVPEYIRPLDKDIHEVFDPQKNKAFRFGEVRRWIILKDGVLAGRIAAFVNKKYRNKNDEGPVGGIGFFDSINDREVATTLFETAREWLLSKGMTAMDGPINFGERDRWWGLVVKGFNPPLYCMNFNQPYYQDLFETYGFQPFYHQICIGMDPLKPLNKKIEERHAIYKDDKDFYVKSIDKNAIPKFAEDFAKVYNEAWAGHGGLKEMKPAQVETMFRKMKPVMDEKILWFAYHKERPIAIFINLPDLNQWFRHLNGGFSLYHKLKFLWVQKTKKCNKFTGLVFGVVPDFQGKGIDAFIIGEADKTVKSPTFPYSDYEMQWIGDFNPRMLNIGLQLGDTFESRRLTTYRFLFDRTKEFKRHPIL